MKATYLSALLLLFSAGVAAQCQIQLSDPVINYGRFTRGDLLSLAENSLSDSTLRVGNDRKLDISIQCDSPTPLALQFLAAAGGAEGYRFGPGGNATLTLSDVWIDNQPVGIISEEKTAQSMVFAPNTTLRFRNNDRDVVGSTLNGKITLSLTVPANKSRVRDTEEWQLNGQFILTGTD